MSSRYHLISLSEPPAMAGAYIYGLEDDEISWTQEGDWLLLLVDHVGLITIGAKNHAYQPWTAFVVSPGNRCRLKRSTQEISCAIWIRFRPAAEGAPMVAIPHMARLEEFGPLWNQRFRLALNRAYQMQKETRAVMTDVLWSIAADPGSIRQSPALEASERYIEENIGNPIRVEALAVLAGVSHNQLIRLFKNEHGVTPLEYVRQRKQYHACRMLLETALPVKQVAAAVGIADLAQFNRLIHAAAGMSPRELRGTVRPPNLFRV